MSLFWFYVVVVANFYEYRNKKALEEKISQSLIELVELLFVIFYSSVVYNAAPV